MQQLLLKIGTTSDQMFVSTVALLSTFFVTKNFPLHSSRFHKSSLIVACLTSNRFEIRILKSNMSKNQTKNIETTWPQLQSSTRFC